MRTRLALCGAVALAACSSPADMSQTIGVEETAQTGDGAETARETLERRVAADAEPFEFSETEGDDRTGMREFSYKWPRQVSALPALEAEFEADYERQLATQKKEWASAQQDCPGDFVSCRNNYLSLEWQVVADTPRFLSLSSNISTYTGGAHGNYGRSGSIWDRESGESLQPIQFFTSPADLDAAVGEELCERLNAERAKRRGGPVVSNADDWASACVPMEDAVLFLGSSDGKAFDRLGVYYGPYVAGAYAEGDFEFTLPVTDGVMETVKPKFRGAFRKGKAPAP
ncbi:MAG: DUF3298 and DUF4163 domain-containing protein [Pseudomonadota bacterium]